MLISATAVTIFVITLSVCLSIIMGQRNAKGKIISYGEDKIIKLLNGLTAQRFPGGLGKILFNKMKEYKDNIAQIDGSTAQTQSYDDLLRRAIRTAIEMHSRGVRPKDIITICSTNHLDTVVPLYATWFLGAIPASLDPRLSLQDATHLINQVRPKIFFVSKDAVELIEGAMKNLNVEAEVVIFGEAGINAFSVFVEEKEGEKEFRPEENIDDMDTAIILFSSGTTGLSKGICLSHYGWLNQVCHYADAMDFSVILDYSSLYWISAIAMISMATTIGGARIVVWDFDPNKVWHYIQKYKVSFLFLTTGTSVSLCKTGRPPGVDTSSLKVCDTGGGERVSTNLMKNLADILPGTFVTQVYGQTEAAGVLTAFDISIPEEVNLLLSKPESCGRPLPSVDEYKVVDVDDGCILGFNEPGELYVKGRFFMKGYHKLDSSIAYDEQGFMKTGDVVCYDEDFCFFVVDRIKELLKYRGWHVTPAVLEEVLLTHPAVSAAVVVGIPNEEDGEHPMAAVILKQGLEEVTEEEIRSYVDERVDEKKKLRGGVVFVESFPRTATGKVNRKLIKGLYRQS